MSDLAESLRSRVLHTVAIVTVFALRGIGLAVLLVPMGLLVFFSFAKDTYQVLPPTGYSLRWYANVFNEPGFVSGFFLSLQIAAVVTATTVVAGVLAAYGQWRFPIVRGRLTETVLSLPILVPAVVIGMALVVLLNRWGWLSAFWNIAVGHTIITLPFVIRTVNVALTRYDRTLEEAAAGMGASPTNVFWHVTLPQIRSGIFAGGLFAFILSFDDFAITIFLIDSNTVPLPVAMYHYLEWNLDPTLSAVSALLVAMSIGVALLIDRLVGLDRFLGFR